MIFDMQYLLQTFLM